jgi:hypothetical protein
MIHKSLIFMVRPGWLEHPTYGFVVRHSIQLSYGRKPLAPSSRPLRHGSGQASSSGGEGDGDKREKREFQENYTNPLKDIQLFLSPSIPCHHQLFHRIFLLMTDN